MDDLLSGIGSPDDLRRLSQQELEQLAGEIRAALCNLVTNRTAHFASNLGVVELCLALHTEFDFSRDRLIWDTGHQIYPHKMVTGRFDQFSTMRQRGGLMGYPNPHESDYDLMMTGHAGCSVSTMLGVATGDDLLRAEEGRRAVAVIGDGALPSGIVFEALNNGGELQKNLLVILNDNKMSICPRVGGLARHLDRVRSHKVYERVNRELSKLLKGVPLVGESADKLLQQFKEALKAGLHGGMLFEELGFRYFGPVEGHDLASLQKYLRLVKDVDGPVLLHVLTEKGHGFQPAAEDPVGFHTPAPFQQDTNGDVVRESKSSSPAYTNLASDAILAQLGRDPRVTVMTAAMCQGTKLERVRDTFPDRFFDVGICESHAVAFAAGQAKVGLRPIVDIYSTFLQRSYDQLFQEVTLQNLPVVFLLDRAGLTGPDGPTHHGVFDLGYLRMFPNMIVMAPGDGRDLAEMLDFALAQDAPTAIRYPKTTADIVDRPACPVELGRGELIEWGDDGMIFCCGTQLSECVRAVATLRSEGIDVGLVNARFVKPVDTELLAQTLDREAFVITVEEASLAGGFGSAVLEAAVDLGLDTRRIRRLGVPDQFVEHGPRDELLSLLGLDADGIIRAATELAGQLNPAPERHAG